MDPAIFQLGQPVLGICYGQQLMAHLLGGEVRKGDKGEYGLRHAGTGRRQPTRCSPGSPAAAGLDEPSRRGGRAARKASRSRAAPAPAPWPPSPLRRAALRRAVPPEVVHTTRGKEYLSNFVFRVCGCVQDWDPRHRVPLLEQEIRECVGDAQRLLFRQRRRRFHASPSRFARARWAPIACAACTSIPA